MGSAAAGSAKRTQERNVNSALRTFSYFLPHLQGFIGTTSDEDPQFLFQTALRKQEGLPPALSVSCATYWQLFRLGLALENALFLLVGERGLEPNGVNQLLHPQIA